MGEKLFWPGIVSAGVCLLAFFGGLGYLLYPGFLLSGLLGFGAHDGGFYVLGLLGSWLFYAIVGVFVAARLRRSREGGGPE